MQGEYSIIGHEIDLYLGVHKCLMNLHLEFAVFYSQQYSAARLLIPVSYMCLICTGKSNYIVRDTFIVPYLQIYHVVHLIFT